MDRINQNLDSPRGSFGAVLTTIIITVLLAGGGVYAWQRQTADQKINEAKTAAKVEAQKEINDLAQKVSDLEANLKAKQDYKYTIETFQSDKGADSKLVKTFEDGSQETIIESSVSQIGNTVCELSFPDKATTLYMRTCNPETDNAQGKIYTYDVSGKQFKSLDNINAVFTSWGAVVASPDKNKVAYVPDSSVKDAKNEGLDQELYIFDLAQDSASKLVTLKGSETFNKGCGAMSGAYEVSWTDDSTISYGVFKQASGTCQPDKTKIEDRQATIK